jgi:predicted aspartyl protease
MLEGYDGSNTLLCDNEGEDQPLQEIVETITEPEITLYALTGWAAPKTMRITARIRSSDVIALIDSGSTHNFISKRLANALRIPVVPTASFTVQVANGEKLKCQGRFEEVGVDLQGTHFSLTLYSLPLTGLDLVLGIQWLEMLGSVVCNWKQLTMAFQWKNQLRQLRGMGDEGIQIASITELTKAIHQNHAIFAICLQISTTEPHIQTTHPDMEAILHEFADILKEPGGLPPTRGVDHCITLKDGIEPINVWPYRYAYYQKEEIDKQVHEMLNSDLIKPSTSPFSSPVLLVKKKDGTWCFCTDYKALNAATVKDRFPIPTVDDMLDELYGASYFTKLDL